MKSIFLLISVVLINFFVSFYASFLLESNQLIYNYYSEHLAQEQINKLIETQQKWAWLGYAIIPLIVLIRSSLVALTLSIGNFFYTLENEEDYEPPKYKSFFRIALYGEFVLLFVGVFKLLYFLFIKTDFTLLDLQQYYPLSFINFLDLDNLDPWLVYPMQTINLFELAYLFVLVYGFWKLKKNKYWQSLEIVGVSYFVSLVIWLGLVMFLMLNIS